jgi:hypothetical protein
MKGICLRSWRGANNPCRNEDIIYDARWESKPEDMVQSAYWRIQMQAEQWGLRFAPISNLNTLGGSYCGLYWDPASTWIVLAFKVALFQ